MQQKDRGIVEHSIMLTLKGSERQRWRRDIERGTKKKIQDLSERAKTSLPFHTVQTLTHRESNSQGHGDILSEKESDLFLVI